MIFSCGNSDTYGCFADSAAYTMVIPPTRPRNIKMIRTVLDATHRSGVIPSVTPTVAMADAASNSAGMMGIFSAHPIKIPPAKNRLRYRISTVAA